MSSDRAKDQLSQLANCLIWPADPMATETPSSGIRASAKDLVKPREKVRQKLN